MPPPRRRRREAAAWFARMNQPGASTSELHAFATWRARPGSAAAWAQVQRTWAAADALRQHAPTRALVEQALATTAPQRARRNPRLAWIGASAAAVAAVGGVAVFGGPSWNTPPGRRSSVVLGDGSHVLLDADTLIRTRWLSGARRVWLVRGEALFDVVHDPAHPFVVDAGHSVVQALGTRFDVLRLGSGARVTLLRGAVVVHDRRDHVPAQRLAPGQSTRTGEATPVKADISSDLSWTQGRLVFDHTPLADAVALMSRHSAAPLRLEDSGASRLVVSGVFSTDDTQGFIAAVADLSGARVERAPSGAVTLRLKASQGGA